MPVDLLYAHRTSLPAAATFILRTTTSMLNKDDSAETILFHVLIYITIFTDSTAQPKSIYHITTNNDDIV